MQSVKDILNSKGSEVWSVKPDDTVFNAIKMMADKGIGKPLGKLPSVKS